MAVDIRPRSSWGARYADGDLTLSGLADEVFAHHSVTAQLSPNASVAEEEAQMRVIESVGQSRFGTGISYNVIVFPSGRAYQGVSFHRRGTHTGGRNSTVRSICFAGNYETNHPTPAQLATAAAIYREGKGKWWKSTAPLGGHRDVSQTACPGGNVYAQLPAIRAGKVQTQQEEPDMDATQAKQLSEIHEDTGEIETIVRQLRVKADRQEAHIVALTATVEAMAQNIGADAKAITSAVTKSVDKALTDLKITLSTEG